MSDDKTKHNGPSSGSYSSVQADAISDYWDRLIHAPEGEAVAPPGDLNRTFVNLVDRCHELGRERRDRVTAPKPQGSERLR